jgi:molecular chaperone DnaK (HSP70)
MSKIIGIDLGTTNGVAAIMVGRGPKSLVNEEGALVTPSVAAWDDNGPALVGRIAQVLLKWKKAAEDIGNVIVDRIVAEFRKTNGVDVTNDKMAPQRLHESTERPGIEPPSMQERPTNLPFLTVGPGGPVHLELRLSRSKLDQMMDPDPLIAPTIVPVRQTLADGRQIIEDIMEVALVGASTRVPLVEKAVKKFFGK